MLQAFSQVTPADANSQSKDSEKTDSQTTDSKKVDKQTTDINISEELVATAHSEVTPDNQVRFNNSFKRFYSRG